MKWKCYCKYRNEFRIWAVAILYLNFLHWTAKNKSGKTKKIGIILFLLSNYDIFFINFQFYWYVKKNVIYISIFLEMSFLDCIKKIWTSIKE